MRASKPPRSAMPADAGVRALQERLNALGFGPLEEDGLWGSRTAAALDRALPPPAVDPVLRRQLQRDEGCRLTAYRDTVGVWTIGYGHTGPEVRQGLTWTQAQADQQLDADILKHNAELERGAGEWVNGLDGPRLRVLQNMCFNMGWPTLSGFHNTLPAIREGRWADAAYGMEHSLWARQVGDRARRLVATMLDGVDR